MANIPQNTSYSSGSSLPKVNYQQLLNLMKQRTSMIPPRAKVSWGGVDNGLAGLDTTQVGNANYPNFELDKQIGNPIPNNFVKLQDYVKNTGIEYPTEPATNKTWSKDGITTNIQNAAASPTTRIQNIAGGSYLTDPSQPGQLIKAVRGDNAAGKRTPEDMAILGSLNPATHQIDHVIPLWAGGDNSITNKQVLSNDEHEMKSKIQAVPYMLMTTVNPKTGKPYISAREAQNMAMNWRTQDDTGLDSYDPNTTTVNIKDALKKYEQWNAVKPVGIKDVLKGIPEAVETAGTWAEKHGAPKPIVEFGKGLSSELLAGYPKYDTSKLSGANLAAGEAGKLVGNLGLFALLTSLTGGGGVAMEAAKAAELGAEGAKAIETTSKARQLYNATTGAVSKTAEKLGLTGLSSPIKPFAELTPEMIEGGKIMVEANNKAQNLKNVLGMSIKLAAMGELHQQDDRSLDAALQRVIVNTMYGGMLGTAGHDLKGYTRVALGSTILGFADSAYNGDPDIAGALQGGLLNAAIHSLGHGSAAAREKMIDQAANESALKFRENYLGSSAKTPNGKYSEALIEAQNEKIISNLVKQADLHGWSDDYLDKMIATANITGRQLWKGGLGSVARKAADEADMRSLAQKVVNAESPDEILANKNIVRAVKDNAADLLSPSREQRLQTINPTAPSYMATGFGSKINMGRPNARLQYYIDAMDQNRTNGTVLILRAPEDAATVRRRERYYTETELKNKDRAYQDNPENVEIIYGMVKPVEGETLPPGTITVNTEHGPVNVVQIGHVATPTRIEGGDTSHNVSVKRMAEQNKFDPTPYLSDPNFNNETLGKAMSEKGYKVMVGDIGNLTKEAQFSGQPFFDVKISDNHWNESQKYNDRLGNRVAKTADLPELIKKAQNEGGRDVINQIADTIRNERPTNASEYLKETATKETMAKQITDDIINTFHQAAEAKTPEQAMSIVNGTYGNVIDETMAKAIIKSKDDLRPVDVMKIVEKSVADGKASDGTKVLYESVVKPFLQTSDFAKDPRGQIFMGMKLTSKPGESKTNIMETPEFKEATAKVAAENPELTKSMAAGPAAKSSEMPEIAPKPGKRPSWGKYTDNVTMDAPARILEAKITVPEELEQAKEVFNKENVKNLISSVANRSASPLEGAEKFTNEIISRVEGLTGEKLNLTNTEKAELSKYYKKTASAHVRPNVEITPEGAKITRTPGKNNIMGKADADTLEYNRKNGLPDDSMEIYKIDNSSKFLSDNGFPVNDSRKKYQDVINKLNAVKDENGNSVKLVVVGKADNSFNSITAVKYEPKLVEKFNENPERYIKPGEKLVKPEDKFLRVYFKDVLGVGDINANEAVKRTSGIFQRFNPYTGPTPDKQVKTYILKSKTIGEGPGLEMNRLNINEGNRKALEDKLGTSQWDGKMIVGEDLFEHLAKYNDYSNYRSKTSLKPIISGNLANGDYMLQKGHIIKADPALRQFLKDEYGIELGKDQLATFQDNIKLGNKNQEVVETPLKNFFLRDSSFRPGSKVTPSILSKFTSKDKLNPLFSEMADKRLQEYNDLVSSVEGSKTGQEIKEAFEKYADQYGIDIDSVFYGVKKELFDNNAGKKRLNVEINKALKNVFVDRVVNYTPSNSGKAYLTPAIKLPLDGEGKPARFPKTDELVIGNKFAKMNNLKDGDEVMIGRNPVTDIANLSKVKVITGDKFGATSLGKEHVMTSHHDVVIKKEADTDGDSIFIFKLGDDGLPKEIGDTIVKNTPKDILIPGVNKGEKLPLTSANLNKVISDQAFGNDVMPSVTSLARVMPMIHDNGTRIVLSKGKAYFTYNGKPMTEVAVPGYKGGDVVVDFEWTPEKQQLLKKVQQESIDASSSNDLVKTTGGDKDYMLKQLIKISTPDGKSIEKDPKIVGAINKAMNAYQAPFNAVNDPSRFRNVDDLLKDVAPFTDMTGKIEAAGGKITPLQEMLNKMFSKVKTSKVDNETIVKSDIAGSKAVQDEFGQQMKTVFENKEYSPVVKEIIGMAQKARNIAEKPGQYLDKEAKMKLSNQKEEYRKKIIEKFEQAVKDKELSQKDYDALAYWAATSKDSNIAWGPGWPTTKFVRKYDEFMVKSPKIAQTYYKAYEE